MRKIYYFVCVLLANVAWCQGVEHSAKSFWQGEYFEQPNLDMARFEKQNTIRAFVYGAWQVFSPQPLPESFISWSAAKRKAMLDDIKSGNMPQLAGPHNAMVASHGILRNDTKFLINNAVKGMGFLPKREHLQNIITMLKQTKEDSLSVKLQTLKTLYDNADSIFDKTVQISLELYATPDFETGTFLNQMENPAVSIVFLDMKSYEIKALAQMLHPKNPKLTEYEKQIVEYANLIHSYFHGHFDRDFIAVVYHVIEVFDNSPGKGGKGKKI